MLKHSLNSIEVLALERGMLEIRPPFDTQDTQKQRNSIALACDILEGLFAEHDHTPESAVRIREDAIAELREMAYFAKIIAAVEGIIRYRTPRSSPRAAIDTPLLLHIGAASAASVSETYPTDPWRQKIAAVVTYTACLAHGPWGAPLPWRDPILPMRRRVTHVPDLRDSGRP